MSPLVTSPVWVAARAVGAPNTDRPRSSTAATSATSATPPHRSHLFFILPSFRRNRGRGPGDFEFWILDFGLGRMVNPKSKIQNPKLLTPSSWRQGRLPAGF